jgi:ATP-dependent DNA ligase
MRLSTTAIAFICRRDGDWVRVFCRRGKDHTDRAPAIADALLALRVKSVTLDREGVICGPDGVTDFDRLRAALGRAARAGVLLDSRSRPDKARSGIVLRPT